MELSVDEEGRKVCTFKDEKITVHIVLKKDFSHVESKLRNINVIKDIETALESALGSDEFKDIVDSHGFLYMDKKDMD